MTSLILHKRATTVANTNTMKQSGNKTILRIPPFMICFVLLLLIEFCNGRLGQSHHHPHPSGPQVGDDSNIPILLQDEGNNSTDSSNFVQDENISVLPDETNNSSTDSSSNIVSTSTDNSNNATIATSPNHIDFSLQLTIAYWCDEKICQLRAFTEVGNQLLLVDSGSSALAFCRAPDSHSVKNVIRMNTTSGEGISECMKYGSGGHGWFGVLNEGTFCHFGGVEDQNFGNVYYTVMTDAVGLAGNQCGDIQDGSVGLSKSASIGGIMGLGFDSTYYSTESMNGVAPTWTKEAVQAGQCGDGQCQCPPDQLATGVSGSFFQIMQQLNKTQYSVTWDGVLGDENGAGDGSMGSVGGHAAILTGEDATKNVPSDVPHIALEKHSERGIFSTNVTAIFVNGASVPMSQPETPYFFDTGTAQIYLPTEAYNAVQSQAASGRNVALQFTVVTVDGGSTTINVGLTPQLIQEGIVVETPSGSDNVNILGLNMLRYLSTVVFNWDDWDHPYMMTVPRGTGDFILDPPDQMKVAASDTKAK